MHNDDEISESSQISDDIINKSLDIKKSIYSEIYDINSEEDYEGDILQTENIYLKVIGKVHMILLGILDGNISDKTISTISELSPETNTKIKDLIKIVQNTENYNTNLHLRLFINNYFFRYVWWLGASDS